MPIYTYRCENCAHEFDLRHGFNEADPDTCPNCAHKLSLHRVYKPVGVVFKGSGFYATDNKSASRANGTSASEKEDAGNKDKKEKKPDTKEKTTTAESSTPSKKTESKKSEK